MSDYMICEGCKKVTYTDRICPRCSHDPFAETERAASRDVIEAWTASNWAVVEAIRDAAKRVLQSKDGVV